MIKLLATIFLLIVSTAVYSQNALTNADIKWLYNTMIGHYSSQAQSERDSAFFDIRLKMVPMWREYEGYWLYVEQAMAGFEDKPYRQRVYQLVLKDDTTIESKVYTIKNGEKYFGDWKKWAPLEQLTLDSLEQRSGCSILLHKKAKHVYEGSTKDKDCESNLKGATYATSTVRITKNVLNSWDRGYDKDDKQVWGAVKGGYEFIKE